MHTMMDLQLFAEEAPQVIATPDTASGAEESAAAQESEEPTVVYGIDPDGGTTETEQPEQEQEQEAESEAVVPPDLEAEFDELIRGKFAQQYKDRVQKNIQQRFKERKVDEQIAQENARLREILLDRYELADNIDMATILSRLEDDASPAEREAMEDGKSEAEIRAERILRKERKRQQKQKEDEALQRRQEAERQRRQQNIETWTQQAEIAKKAIPNLDLVAELKNQDTGEQFLALLENGVDVERAYKTVHLDEIIKASVRAAAGEASKRTVDDIRARGQRPPEGANMARKPVVRKTDPSQFTEQDILNIAQIVKNGGKVNF